LQPAAAGTVADALQSLADVGRHPQQQFLASCGLRFESGNVQLWEQLEAPGQEEVVPEGVQVSFKNEAEFFEGTQLGQTPKAGFGRQ